jgi:MinD superfamily P-loop ATPase
LLAHQQLWSEASKRSRSYEPNAEVHYYNRYYWCATCEAACVFTALEQQQVFEVEKRYIHTTRSLCDSCHKASGHGNEGTTQA